MSNMKPAHTAKPEMKLSMPAVKRLLAYLKQYKAVLVIVTVCILLSAGATRRFISVPASIDRSIYYAAACGNRSGVYRSVTGSYDYRLNLRRRGALLMDLQPAYDQCCAADAQAYPR